MAHSVFESWLHPNKFRTQLCCFGDSCHRRICFFAHNSAQLRAATPSPVNPTGHVLRRTQTVVSVNTPAAQQMVTAAVTGPAGSVLPVAGLPAAAGATVPLQMQGYYQPAATGVQELIAPTSSWTAYNVLPTAGLPPAAAAPPPPTAAVAPGSIVTVSSGADISGLTAGLQGLMLQQVPGIPLLQQQAAEQFAAASVKTIPGQVPVMFVAGVNVVPAGAAAPGPGQLPGNYDVRLLTSQGMSTATAARVDYMALSGAAGSQAQYYH